MTNDDKKLAPMAQAAIAVGLTAPIDPVSEMEMEQMREIVERRRAFDKAVDEVIRARVPAQGMKGDILPLRLYPDPILTEPCDPIEEFDGLFGGSLKGLIADMAFTMYLLGGVGLAGPQVGLPYRILVMDATAGRPDVKDRLRVFINPRIVSASNPVRMEEGCLSMPGLKPRIERPNDIRVEGLSRRGKKTNAVLTGWEARIFLHEYDHLDGKTMLDRLSATELRLAKKKLARVRRHIEGKVKNRRKPKRRKH